MIFFSSAPRIRSHGFAVAVTVAAGNDILEMVPMFAGQGPVVVTKKTLSYSARRRRDAEHRVVQQ